MRYLVLAAAGVLGCGGGLVLLLADNSWGLLLALVSVTAIVFGIQGYLRSRRRK